MRTNSSPSTPVEISLRFSHEARRVFMIRVIAGIVACLKVLAFAAPAASAVGESLDPLVAGGKKEAEVTLIASASTFGGKKGFSDLEAAFNKKYGLRVKVNLSPGPNMPQVASRVLTELKAGIKSSTRSEEHTSELQSRGHLVCRLLLE